MDYETISSFLLTNFFLTDWERTWIEGRFEINNNKEQEIWKNIMNKYLKINTRYENPYLVNYTSNQSS